MPTWVVTEQTSVDTDAPQDAIDRVVNCIDGEVLLQRADLIGAEPTMLPAAQLAALRGWAAGLEPGDETEQLARGRHLVRELIDTLEPAAG